jgi:hypothetical protein
MQHERQPLGRTQRVQHHQERETDRVRQQGLVLGVAAGILVADNRLGQPGADVALPARFAAAQHVQAHAPDDGGQPAAEVRDAVIVGPAQAQPRLLYGVLGVADRPEHSIRDRRQVRAVGFELLCRPGSRGHQIRLLVHARMTDRARQT